MTKKIRAKRVRQKKDLPSTEQLRIKAAERKHFFYGGLVFLLIIAGLIVLVRPQYTELVISNIFSLLGGMGISKLSK